VYSAETLRGPDGTAAVCVSCGGVAAAWLLHAFGDRQSGRSGQGDHAVLDSDGVAARALREGVRPRLGGDRDPGEPAAVDAIGRRQAWRGAGVRNRGAVRYAEDGVGQCPFDPAERAGVSRAAARDFEVAQRARSGDLKVVQLARVVGDQEIGNGVGAMHTFDGVDRALTLTMIEVAVGGIAVVRLDDLVDRGFDVRKAAIAS
jgi:hypothetical protein